MASVERLSAGFALFTVVILATTTLHSGSVVAEVLDLSHTNLNDFQDQIPSELANANITDKGRKLLRDKCIEVAGETNGTVAFEEIEKGAATLMDCVTTIVNMTAIQAEIDEASPRGDLDVVFNKYCKQRDDMYSCIVNFNKKFVPCLEKDELENQATVMRIVHSLLDFICHKGGDQIALFIAEKGPECLSSKQNDIQQCFNNTFAGYMPAEGIENVQKLPRFVIEEKQCQEMQVLENCIVNSLETCEEITPANIVESMFRFIKNETICRTSSSLAAKQSGGKGGAGQNTPLALNVILYGAAMALFLLVGKYSRA